MDSLIDFFCWHTENYKGSPYHMPMLVCPRSQPQATFNPSVGSVHNVHPLMVSDGEHRDARRVHKFRSDAFYFIVDLPSGCEKNKMEKCNAFWSYHDKVEWHLVFGLWGTEVLHYQNRIRNSDEKLIVSKLIWCKNVQTYKKVMMPHLEATVYHAMNGPLECIPAT